MTAPGVLPVNSGLALESLRNSTFDTTSAIGEIIDNSIQADSKIIHVQLDVGQVNEGQRGRPKYRITRLAVGDDGIGMDAETLQRCLQLGFSTRYDDRDGIGRFGVGMTLGAINQCRHVEVYAREEGNDELWTYLSLDEVKKAGESARIPPPRKKTPSADDKKLAGNKRGTIVIWETIDRMYVNDVDEIRHWISRTYRKFLSEKILKEPVTGGEPTLTPNSHKIRIIVNGAEVQPFDPLYHVPAVAGDPPSQLGESIVFDWPIDDPLVDKKKHGANGKITIRFALLPTRLRPARGWGDSKEAKERFIPENVGISILRNRREVYYGSWIPILDLGDASLGRLRDRYWGAEIEFPPTLDNNFQVRNIKVGASPLVDLAIKLKELMLPTIDYYRDEIGRHWDKVEAEKTKNVPETARKHAAAEAIAAEVAPPVKLVPVTPERKQEIIKQLVPESAGKTEKEVAAWLEAIGRFAIVESADADPKGWFFDITPVGSKTIIHYTLRHPFFLEVFNHLTRVEELAKDVKDPTSGELVEHVNALKLNIDLLLTAYANSRNLIVGEGKGPEVFILQRLMDYWSSTLRELIERQKAGPAKGE